MGIGVINVLAHGSIGVGEDCPTHEPVEPMAAVRAIPNLLLTASILLTAKRGTVWKRRNHQWRA